MKLWIDADACPNQVKEIMYKAANRKKIQLTLVANQYINIPKSPFITMTQVESGFDVADDYIVANVEPNDLVITSDIPLADELITKGAKVLTSRGEAFTEQNIKQKLNMRDFMETMRSSGIQSGGPAPLNAQDIQQFANALDRYLTKSSAP